MKTLILILTSTLILSGCFWNEKKQAVTPVIPGAKMISVSSSGTTLITQTGSATTETTPYHETP